MARDQQNRNIIDNHLKLINSRITIESDDEDQQLEAADTVLLGEDQESFIDERTSGEGYKYNHSLFQKSSHQNVFEVRKYFPQLFVS